MTSGFNAREKVENEHYGNLFQDNTQDFLNLRLSMGKSISAPPPGLTETLTSSTPELNKNDQDPTATKDYYYYYHSIKPHDPRLPLPKWKPSLFHQGLTGFHNIIQEGNSESGGTNPDESTGDDFSSHFDQSINLNSTKDSFKTEGQYSHDSKHHYDNDRRMSQQNQNRGYDQRHNQNHFDKKGGFTNGNHNQNRTHGHHQNNQQKSYNQQHFNQQTNTGNFGQQGGQFYPQDQQTNKFYGGGNNNYMNQQMQSQQYYGMNTFQPQMYPYGMDPSMMGNMNPMGGYNAYPMMSGMNVNPMYMNGGSPYMNNYYPMGMQQNMTGGGGGGYQQNFQGNNQFGNKNQKPMGKGNYQGGHQGGHQGHQGHQGQHGHQSHQGQHGQHGHQGHQNYQNHPKLDIKQVLANLLENCRDQNGSRLIQQHFEKADEEERERIFQEIAPHAPELMTDLFGNYVIQKILELGTNEQRQRIFETMNGNVYRLSQNTYGCRVVQKILEEFRSVQFVQDMILSEIKQNTVSLIEDQNGNHVIQKCFDTVHIEKLQFIIEEVTKRIEALAVHPFGCRVIQKILETSPENKVAPMLRKLMNKAIDCCQCQYGNYIMQHLLEKGPQAEKEMLLEILRKNFVKLSMNKFASNVTEKSVIFGSPEYRADVINTLVSGYADDNRAGLVALMTNSFGNYVVQKLFDLSDDKSKRKLYDRVRQENIEEIKKNSFGRHVMGFIEKWIESQRI